MEHNTLQRRSTGTIKNMGVNSYSQIVSAFRAQGDLTDDQLTILPVLQNALGISRERHTAEVKRALYDEQLSDIALSINPSSNTANWEAEANYACPTIIHQPPNTKYIQIAEQLLQTTPPTTILQHPQPTTTTKLNRDLQQLLRNETRQDGIINATQQQVNQTTKQNFNNFNNTDIQGSKVIRLVRAKQATKRKSSLDTLIEVVQKELLRVNGQTNSISPPSSPPYYSHTRSLPSSKLQNRISHATYSPHRSAISSILPSSHPGSLTSQSNHSFKLARKRGLINLNNSKKVLSFQQRNRSFNNNHDDEFMDHDGMDSSRDETQSGPENIEEIVRDTVDRLVAITLLNTAPFVVNMLTAIPGNGNNTNTESQISSNNTSMIKSQSSNSRSDHYRNDLALLSSTASDLRTSIHQASPLKQQQQQQIHHPQLIIQPATANSISTIQGTTTPTLFVAPRILNFQTVVPKPTTNIQIGNTKIILVSPSNINKHLPHSTIPTTTSHQSNLVNNSSVKLVKFTTTNNNTNSIPARSTTSTLTLPKNVQIVVPSHPSSTIQSVRTHNDDVKKSFPITTTSTFRPITTVPMALTTCPVDQIPQAAQEVTISTSPTSSPPLQATTSDLQQQSSSSSSLAAIADNTSPVPPTVQQQQQQQQQSVASLTRTSPSQDELIKSVAVNFQQQSHQLQRSSSTHGPMIYRMTSVNPNVPVFRVRATTAPTSSTVMNKSIKTDAKPISVTTTTNMCYEPKPTHTTTTPSGSVSVLACFKTTKKRNKERAIMPRPSINDPNETSTANNLSTTSNPNTSLIVTSDIIDANSSPDYHRQSSSTPTNFIQQTSLSSTLSDDNTSNMFPLYMQEPMNDTTTSSPNSIPISRDHQNIADLNSMETTPNLSPIQSTHSISRPIMEDKSIQCINEEEEENSMERDSMDSEQKSPSKKRAGEEENWTVAADCLLRDILSQSDFGLLDASYQQILSSKFDLIQANLLNGTFSSKKDFYHSVLDIKKTFVDNDLSKPCENNLEQIFNYFETEFAKLCDDTNEHKRIRRQ